uniref:Ribosomal RNA-processing protein 40 n=1 Tax=Chrysotila carterae TaxID=13221 RepID=A0A7S4AXW6_CHRCT
MAAASTLPAAVGSCVFPGDVVAKVEEFEQLVLGRGVIRDGDHLRAACVGVLKWEAPTLWIEGEQKRYIPVKGDQILGVVLDKNAEDYKLDIGAAAQASLPILAFDGATKRNRPHLQVGTLVYVRVVLANKDIDPEVTCTAPPGIAAKDWVTKESVFGELVGGHVFECPLPLCRNLATTDAPVLQALGDLAPFEICVGVNGRVWLNAERPATVAVAQQASALSQLEFQLPPPLLHAC